MSSRPALLISIVALVVLASVLSVLAQPDSERALRRERQKQCRNWLRLAGEYQAQGNYQEALNVADSALSCDERNPDAFYIKGRAHAKLGDTTEALNNLRLGVSLAPLSSRLKLYLAVLYEITGEQARADSLIDATLAYKPNEPQALYLKARSYLILGDTLAALDHFEKALSISLKRNNKNGK